MDADPEPHVTRLHRWLARHWPRVAGWVALFALWPAIFAYSHRLPSRDAFTVDNLDEMGRTATMVLILFLVVFPIVARGIRLYIAQASQEARELSDASAQRIASAVVDEIQDRQAAQRPGPESRRLRVARKDPGRDSSSD
jgi:hypothetical protein